MGTPKQELRQYFQTIMASEMALLRQEAQAPSTSPGAGVALRILEGKPVINSQAGLNYLQSRFAKPHADFRRALSNSTDPRIPLEVQDRYHASFALLSQARLSLILGKQ